MGEKKAAAKNNQEKQEKLAQQQSELENLKPRDFLASGSRDKSIKLWEAKSGKCILTLVGHDNWISDLVFHTNGKYLISVSDDKTMRVWDL